ncbi:FUSC family protein [Pseudoduganella armeniaca]|uniref:Fusaric acid resistance protein n=1 Tax=Pseudoduganella armeniaca TaxID=2072590 RepID=A0A2R4C8P9_9BURK|nr:FUSC family protein [Pseudoduganella armeniaca]AVR95938.1 fusaric acid resistance protein [Pseudoduganella armeniaca]
MAQGSTTSSDLPAWLAAQLRGWAASDGERLIFVARSAFAAFLALWIAFRLGLDSPGTAMTTTFILALPSSGMVLEKAFYRLLGTVVGCGAALLLIALFPQQAPVLLVGLALWVGLCTAGAAMHRNQQSYSFVLAGYTACMIAVPALEHPAGVFAAAVTRTTEVALGVIVAAVVHDVLFPRAHGRQVRRTVQARYDSFLAFCRQVLAGRLTPAQAELAHLRFAADIAALESGRAAAFFETGARGHTRQLHAFNGAFMTALTTFYTLHRLLHRADAASPVPALRVFLDAPLHALLAGSLEELPAALAPAAGTARAALAARTDLTRGAAIDAETAIELAERFALHLAAFDAIYRGLAQDKRQQVSEPQAYAPKTPPGIVLASGARAAFALLAAATLWYWLAWGQLATSLVMTTVFCALASSSPRPTAMVRQVMTGFLIATPLTFATEFLLVIRASDFPMLVLAAVPLFALALWLMTDPKRAGIGIGMAMFSSQFVAPVNLMHYDAVGMANGMLAQIAGVLLAWVIFAVLLPEHTMGNREHVRAALWREAAHACRRRLGDGKRLRHRFDNRVRDLLSQLNAAAGPTPPAPTRAVVREGLTLLELGHAVIDLRLLLAASMGGPVRNALQAALARLADYLRAPVAGANGAAVAALLDAGGAIRAALATGQCEPDRAARLRTALVDLHAIYTSLLDQAADTLDPTGAHHAA